MQKMNSFPKIDLASLLFLSGILFINFQGLQNELLFHFVIEVCTMIIGFCLFAIIWTIRDKIDNGFFFVFTNGLIFTAYFDLMHILTFEGMVVFPNLNINHSLYFLIIARLLQGLTFLIAPLFTERTTKNNFIFIFFIIVIIAGTYLVYTYDLPLLINPNGEYSTTRISLEVLISLFFLFSIIHIFSKRKKFEKEVFKIIIISILFSTASEITIALNTSSTHLVSVIGLDLRLIAYFLFLQTILVIGIEKPQTTFYQGLKANWEHLQNMIENLNEGIIVIDLNDNFQFSNPAADLIFDIEKGKLQNYRITDFIDPDSISNYKDQKEIIKKKKTSTSELEIINSKQEKRSLIMTASPQIVDGKLIGIFSIFRDITARKRETEKLDEARRFYQTLFQDAPIRIWENDYSQLFLEIHKLKEQGVEDFREYFNLHPEKTEELAKLVRIRNYNNLVRKQYLASTQKTQLTSLTEVFWEESYLLFTKEILAIAEGKTSLSYEMTTRIPSGDIRYSIVNWAVLPGYENDYSRVILSADDITDRKILEEEFQSLARFPQENPNPVMRITKNGEVLYSNQGSKIILKKWCSEKSMLVPIEIQNIIKSCLKNNEPEILEVETGKQIISLHFAPILDLDYVNIYGRDVTQLKNTEAKLLDYSKDLEKVIQEKTKELILTQEKLIKQERLATMGKLAGSVGHELRNPLAVINNALYILKANDWGANKSTQQYLEIIDQEVASANKIITDLLTFAQIKPANLNFIHPKSMVENVLSKFVHPDNVVVKNLLIDELDQVYADDKQIEQVIANLVINAYQAMPTGGELIISGTKIQDNVQLVFSDTGIGIPPENIEIIFDPLFTTKLKGIGLGLTVSKILTEINGGSIVVESALEKGTKFTLNLPTKSVKN